MNRFLSSTRKNRILQAILLAMVVVSGLTLTITHILYTASDTEILDRVLLNNALMEALEVSDEVLEEIEECVVQQQYIAKLCGTVEHLPDEDVQAILEYYCELETLQDIKLISADYQCFDRYGVLQPDFTVEGEDYQQALQSVMTGERDNAVFSAEDGEGGTLLRYLIPTHYKDGQISGVLSVTRTTESFENDLNAFRGSKVAYSAIVLDREGNIILKNKSAHRLFPEDKLTGIRNRELGWAANLQEYLTSASEEPFYEHFQGNDTDFLLCVVPLDSGENWYAAVVLDTQYELENLLGQNRFEHLTILILEILIFVWIVGALWLMWRQMHASSRLFRKSERDNDIFIKALLADSVLVLRVNLTDNKYEKILASVDNAHSLDVFRAQLKGSVRLGIFAREQNFDKTISEIATFINEEDRNNFLIGHSVSALLRDYEEGRTVRRIDYRIPNGTKETALALTSRMYLYSYPDNNDRFALLVVYDLTEEKKAKESIRSLSRSLENARFRLLAGQIQPHFLYNSLASIREVMLEDPRYASDLLYDFTTYLRATLRNMTTDSMISIAQEMDNIRAYTNIEKMRFGEKLKVAYDLRGGDYDILPLCLQPLVENSIRHGILPKGRAGGTVTVRTWNEAQHRLIQVEDDGVGFNVEETMEKIRAGKQDSQGLQNLIYRLENGLGAKVEIQSAPGEGCCTTIWIPIEDDLVQNE